MLRCGSLLGGSLLRRWFGGSQSIVDGLVAALSAGHAPTIVIGAETDGRTIVNSSIVEG